VTYGCSLSANVDGSTFAVTIGALLVVFGGPLLIAILAVIGLGMHGRSELSPRSGAVVAAIAGTVLLFRPVGVDATGEHDSTMFAQPTPQP